MSFTTGCEIFSGDRAANFKTCDHHQMFVNCFGVAKNKSVFINKLPVISLSLGGNLIVSIPDLGFLPYLCYFPSDIYQNHFL